MVFTSVVIMVRIYNVLHGNVVSPQAIYEYCIQPNPTPTAQKLSYAYGHLCVHNGPQPSDSDSKLSATDHLNTGSHQVFN